MADATAPVVNVSENSIFAQIRKEQFDFMYNYIQIVPGYPFNQYETIKRCHLYLNSKYENSAQFLGRDKLFFNVVVPPCEVATKMLNLDTKNIRLWPTEPKSYFSTYLLEKELKYWLKKSKMGKLLNEIAEEAPRYGSVLIEKTTDGARLCDLRRTFMDSTVDKIKDSRFITQVSYMTDTQLMDTGWDNVDVAIERFANRNAPDPYEDNFSNVNVMRSTPYIKVFKRYGEVPAWWVDNKLKPGTKAGDENVKSLFIVAGADTLQKNADGKPMGELGVVLYKSRWRKEWPFKDFHYTKTKGRWLGIGVVEMLFDTQERINELKNQKRVSMEISSMHLFQGPSSMLRNILTDTQSGDYFAKKEGSDGITPIANEERNLPAFKDEEESYFNQADKLTFAYEAVRGDQTDSSKATLGQTQIAVGQSTSVFAFKKENMGLFLQEFFNDLVLPQLMRDLTPEHIMRFTGSSQELAKLDEAAAELHANSYVKSELLNGRMATMEDLDAAKAEAKKQYQKMGANRFLKIKDNFYDDAEFEFDFLITGEQADPANMANNIQAVLADVGGNPAILQDPRLKVLFYKLCENLGISQAEIELADQQSQNMPQPGQPVPGQVIGPAAPQVPMGNLPQQPALQTSQ